MPVVIEGEIALPTNPNGVSYSTDAHRLFNKSWLDLQRVGVHALEAFHGMSAIDGMVAFGRRMSLDRQNHPLHQVTLTFVFDGPATRDQFDAIGRALDKTAMGWSPPAVIPVSRHAFPSLMAKSGRIYQLWVATPQGNRAFRLIHVGQELKVEAAIADESDHDEFLNLRHVLAVPGPLREADVEIERLKLAFAHEISRRIIEADGTVDPEEQTFIEQVFPAELMRRLQLGDDATRVPYAARAADELRDLLGHHEKLALLGLFFAACHSDGQLKGVEMKILKEAATHLGLDGHEIVDYLKRLW